MCGLQNINDNSSNVAQSYNHLKILFGSWRITITLYFGVKGGKIECKMITVLMNNEHLSSFILLQLHIDYGSTIVTTLILTKLWSQITSQ